MQEKIWTGDESDPVLDVVVVDIHFSTMTMLFAFLTFLFSYAFHTQESAAISV